MSGVRSETVESTTRLGRRAVRATDRPGFVQVVRTEIPILVPIAIFAAAAVVGNRLIGVPGRVQWTASFALFGLFAVLYAFVAHWAVLLHTVFVRKRSLRRLRTWQEMASTLWAPRRTSGLLLVCFGLAILMPVFVVFKQAIPTLNPFSWDATFMEWDRWLHLGRHPFEWLQPLLGHPLVTKFVDFNYFLWIHVMWMTVIWQAWHGKRDTPTRSQFLLAFVLSWILIGTIMATLLSSAGPVYYAEVTGLPDPYVPLMDYLAATDGLHELRALMLQDALWTSYTSDDGMVFAGISAMPSMHVAVAALLAFLGFRISPTLGWAYSAFALMILIGSVHLGWHYAIDGYASLIAVAFIWVVSGRIVRWWNGYGKPSSQVMEPDVR